MKYDQAVQLAREAGLFIPQAGIPENGALMRFVELVEIATLEGQSEKTTGNLVHIKLNVMRTALENIAGIRPIVNNLLSDRDIALIALERINTYEQRKN